MSAVFVILTVCFAAMLISTLAMIVIFRIFKRIADLTYAARRNKN